MEATDPFAGLFQSDSEAKPQDKAPAAETATPAWQRQSPASSAASPVSTSQPLSTSKSLNNGIESNPSASFVSMGDSKAKKTKEAEASVRSVESVLDRFTQHIQGVVDSINRYFGSATPVNHQSMLYLLHDSLCFGKQAPSTLV